ncbi:hypothetical protein [Sphingobium chungbukense]|nr:hypothetical protein [Sphingobium chungbukense]
MSAPAHIAASIFMLGMGIGSCWLIYVHLRAYRDQIVAALMMEPR